MKLYQIRGGNENDLLQKKYNIGIGISLGSKWFVVENIIEAIKWSLMHTRKSVVVYVADSIHSINIEVRKRVKYEKALILANEMGQRILSDIKSEVSKSFSEDDTKRIFYSTWAGVADSNYKKKTEYLYSLYENNSDFKGTIHEMVKNHISRTDKDRNFTEQDFNRLGMYIIEEMPEVINRVLIGGMECDAYLYPYDGELTRLVEQIQYGRKFPEIKKHIMDTEPKVFLEVK